MTRFSQYRDDLKAALEERMVPIEGGPLDGAMMLSAGVMQQVLASVEVPPPDEHEAELTEPATVHLRATCHTFGCGVSIPLTGNLESYTKSRAKGAIAGLILISSPVTHTCGQSPLPFGTRPADGQTEAWDIASITGADAAPLDDDGLVDLLRRVNVWTDAETVGRWSEPERDAAKSWCVAQHVYTVEGGEAPARPPHVPEPGEPSFIADLPASDTDEAGTLPDAEGEPDPCPYAGCTLYAEHKGRHIDAHGQPMGKATRKPKATKADPVDVAALDATPDDADGDARPDVPEVFRDALGDDPDLLPE